ncbi:MAG TPA: DMT family transporter [Solirubrobacteraceae bacterium]
MPDALLQPIFVLLWSSGYVVGALASQVSGPVPLLATRFILASLVTVPVALRSGRLKGAPLRRLAVIGLLFQVIQFGGIYGGFALGVPAGLSALVMLGLSPLVTTGLAIAGGQETHDRRMWSGLVIGIAGVVIGLIPELGHARIGAGLVVTAVGMLGLAGGSVLQKRWGAGVDPMASAAVQSLTGAVVMAPVLAIAGGRYVVGPQLVLSLAWLGVGMGMGTLLVLVNLLARHDASRVSALLLLVPAVTAIASVPALGEALHPATVAGMAVSGAGVWVAIRSGGTRRPNFARSAAERWRAASRPRTPAGADGRPARP